MIMCSKVRFYKRKSYLHLQDIEKKKTYVDTFWQLFLPRLGIPFTLLMYYISWPVDYYCV